MGQQVFHQAFNFLLLLSHWKSCGRAASVHFPLSLPSHRLFITSIRTFKLPSPPLSAWCCGSCRVSKCHRGTSRKYPYWLLWSFLTTLFPPPPPLTVLRQIMFIWESNDYNVKHYMELMYFNKTLVLECVPRVSDIRYVFGEDKQHKGRRYKSCLHCFALNLWFDRYLQLSSIFLIWKQLWGYIKTT